MVDIVKQINYWQTIAENDAETATILINSGKFIEGMFFCHLCIEKILKALVVKLTESAPPRTHDLFYLVDMAKMDITDVQSEFMQILMKFQLEGRYPQYYPKAPSVEKINTYLCNTKNLLQCFSKML